MIYRFITKPWAVDDLCERVREAFRPRKRLKDIQRMREQLLSLQHSQPQAHGEMIEAEPATATGPESPQPWGALLRYSVVVMPA